ncbi:N-acetylmuramoyl-L-alanine amidase [Rhodococcoides trifolii]|uniref:N-acetylmuramoyl-L-alanine amidase n=1 Tax=Rhodococcoides trifolii TaxID=908250 RepID=UPI001667428E|nr:N-acetylmuramoyl-L-alanine amidase [Rhodococcus trifolii]
MVSRTGDPIWIPDVLRAEGLICHIFDGALNNGHGDFGLIWGIVGHHMGSAGTSGPGSIARHPSLGLASQLYLGRNGEYTLCGVGIAWHAGEGSWNGLPKNDANSRTIGIEAENSGTEGWTPVQYDAYMRGVGAILRALEYGSDRFIGHKEWGAIQGKWDPGGMDMNKARRDSQAVIDRRPTVAIVNEIDESAKRNPWVGDRVRPEEITIGADQLGRLGVFTNAHIYFHPTTGAYPIPHKDPAIEKSGLFEAYGALGYERGILGYPVREFSPLDTPTGKGAVQAFQGGVLYRKDGADGYVVHGEIGKRWAAEGYEKGDLGWPISNETVDANGNRVQLFENGSLYWHSTSVVKLTRR